MPKNLKNLTLRERQGLPRQRAAVLENFNADERTATLSFASETPVMDWWGEAEILRCNDESMDVTRFNNGVMPLLFNHNRNAVIGRPTKLWNENGKAYAEIQFDDDDESKRIMKKVESNSLRGVSVGYRVKEWRIIKKGEKSADGIEGPAWIAERWEVFEISIVSIPADTSVGVGRSLIYDENVLNNNIRTIEEGEEEMSAIDERNQLGTGNPDPAPVPTPEPAPEENTEERERALTINALCRQHGIDANQNDEFIRSGATVDAVRASILDILAARQAPAPTLAPNIVVGASAADKKRAVYRDAFMQRSGIALAAPVAGSERFRHMPMMDIARDMLMEIEGRSAMEYDAGRLFERAMTTTQLPLLFNEITEASLKEGYKSANVTFEKWVNIGSLADFKEHRDLTIGVEDEPIEIPENGEFKDSTLKAATVAKQLKTFGRKFTYTRQCFINDDKNVLVKIPQKLGRKYPIIINRQVYEALAKGNYKQGVSRGTSAPLNTLSLGEALAMLQTKINPLTKELMHIKPMFLIVPVALQVTAATLLHSMANPDAAHSGVANIFKGALQLIVDAELDMHSKTTWYVAGEQVDGEGIEVDFLNGSRTPIIEGKPAFDTLGYTYRIYHDFGVKMLSDNPYIQNQGVAAQV